MFQPQHIKWIKNVTRDGGKDWAYMEYSVGDIFELRFPNNPNWFPKNYSKPSSKELLVLFQTLLPTRDVIGGWYVTHLISPVDSIVEQDDHPSHPYKRLVLVVGKTEPPFLIDKTSWSFFKPNRGQVCNIKTIESKLVPDYSILQKQTFIWNAFKNIDIGLYEEIENINDLTFDNEIEAIEGGEKTFMRLHKTRERNREILAILKERAKRNGHFHCEVCLFNFEKTYPELGEGFIECHHRTPISTGGIRITKAENLALVCSNCHRMLHRKLSGRYLTIEELRRNFF